MSTVTVQNGSVTSSTCVSSSRWARMSPRSISFSIDIRKGVFLPLSQLR